MRRTLYKKPVKVEAIRWDGTNLDAVQEFTGVENFKVETDEALVFDFLHDTWVKVYVGQWIIQGVKNEFYPCADDVLWETYGALRPLSPNDSEMLRRKCAELATNAYQGCSGHPDRDQVVKLAEDLEEYIKGDLYA